MARLLDIVAGLLSASPDAVIVAVPPWSAEAEAYLVSDEDDAPDGSVYLLEVGLAREAIAVWSQWRKPRTPSPEDACEAVIYYASNDAYLPT